jgi:hypothetical protein
MAHVSSYVANFHGPPELPKLSELKILRNVLTVGVALLILAASEAFPPVNDLLGLVPMGERTDQIVLLLVAHLVGAVGIACLHRRSNLA